MEGGLGQVQEKDAEIKRLQRELEGYKSGRECVEDQMVMEMDDKKRTMGRLRAGKKKFKVRTIGGGHCIFDAMSFILLPSQAGIMHKQRLPLHSHMVKTKEEMKIRVREGRV